MPIHLLTLVGRKEVAKSTVEFAFSKPPGFTYKPGQYGGFTLINPSETDAGGITRRFSLLTTPDDDHIKIAIRMQTSAYKRTLNELPLGSEIKFAGPTGNFTLHEDTSIPAVFIAGGIGITPFYSMIQHATLHKSPQAMHLFYGNQSQETTAYYTDFMHFQAANPQFTFIPTMEKPDNMWNGEQGFISHTMIKKYIPDLAKPIYYICGGPAMVTTLQELLAEMGVDEDKIKVEDFPGY